MHKDLKDVPDRILDVAIGALIQANQHAAYAAPGMGHWGNMCVLNAALAGELFLKAIIAKEHPLLIFRDLFQLDDPKELDLKIEYIVERGRTYNFEHLPKLLWVSTGERLPDIDSFEQLRAARNALQHFCAPASDSYLRRLSMEFLYKNIDPLINKHFDLFAIEYHEDTSAGYDYVVDCLLQNELLFSIPNQFSIAEINFQEKFSDCSKNYRTALTERFVAKGIDVSKL